jgi:hypothetical protein
MGESPLRSTLRPWFQVDVIMDVQWAEARKR